jgi:hypothetical protein
LKEYIMAYNPPPHYSLGGPSDPQQPQSVPPAYSPQPPQPVAPGYGPQAPSQPPPQPTQGIPVQPTYATQQFQPLPAPPQQRSPKTALLAIGMVVGLAGAAVMLALWLRTSGDLEDVEARIDDRDDQIQQLEEDLEAAQAQVSELEGSAADAESMQACLDALNEYYNTAAGSAEEATALDALEVECDGWIF